MAPNPDQPGRFAEGEAAALGVTTARFETRKYSLSERVLMELGDAVLAAIGAVMRLGGVPLKNVVSSVLGWIGYLLFVDKRRIARVNLDLVYGESLSRAEKERIVRAMFHHFVRLGLDFIFDTTYWPLEKLHERVRVVGIEKLSQALAIGRGLLCVSGHLGNWEIMCASAAAHGYDFFGVFKRPKGAWVDRFIGRKRLRYGMSLVEAPEVKNQIVDGVEATVSVRSLRDEIAAIWASGRAVAYLCDQRPRKRVMKVPFLGILDTATAGGLIRYAVDNQVPLTFHSCVYEADGNLVWTIEGPTEIVDQGGGEATTLHYLALINAWLSGRIKEHPEQWTWGHRRFDKSHYARQR